MTDKWRGMVHDLLEAAEHGRDDDVRRLLRAGVHVDARDPHRRTPLMLAAQGRHLPVVRALLGRGADPNARDTMTWTAMTCAVNRPSPRFTAHTPWWSNVPPSPPILDALVGAGGVPGLREAVILGDASLTRSLCGRGADPGGDALWFYHDTYLMVAVDLGHREVARALLDRGADIEGEDDLGDRALMRAAAAGRADLVAFLLDRGADVDARNWAYVSALDMAAVQGHRAVVDLLLSRGARRSLLEAVACDDAPLIRSLLADPRMANGLPDYPDRCHYCPIGRPAMYAAGRGRVEAVRLLVEHGAAHLDHLDDRPLLAEAARHGHLDVVQWLLAAGADVTAVGRDGITALEWAARGGHEEVVHCLHVAAAGDRAAV